MQTKSYGQGVTTGSISPHCQNSQNLTMTLSGVISLPALPTAAAEATKSTATEATKSASLTKAVAKTAATKAVAKTATRTAALTEAATEATPATLAPEPITPIAALETAEPVLACAARLLFAVCPRRVTPSALPAARCVLLPPAAAVPVHVAVGVGIVIVANARRPERVGLARSRIVRRRLRRAPIAFRTGGRRRGALDRTPTLPRG